MRIFCFIVLMFDLSSSCFAVPKRIVSLSPHTTELIYVLGAGDKLLATSDFSDYPQQAALLPSVADHNGIDLERILSLRPDLIVAWKGGNKPQDLARLESMGLTLFYSNPKHIEDIADEVLALGVLLGEINTAQTISENFNRKLQQIRKKFKTTKPKRVFYYMWPKPLMSIGKGAWANQMLAICGADNIFADSITDYPQVTIEKVITQKPSLIVAAMKASDADVEAYWQPWRSLIDVPIKVVNPDLLHRFTPRTLIGLEELCNQLN